MIFDLVGPNFTEIYGYMQYLLGDGVFFILLMILLAKWNAWVQRLTHKIHNRHYELDH